MVELLMEFKDYKIVEYQL